MTDPAPPRALDYAAPPSARRRLLRRLRRWWPAWLLLVVVGLGVAYGPAVWRRWQVLRLQAACLTAELPADRPVYEGDPAAARALVAAWPGEYALDPDGRAARFDPRWTALARALGVPAGLYYWPTLGRPTVFCHERRTPGGRRRLVVVEDWWDVTVIDPAGWPVGDGPKVLWREGAAGSDAASLEVFRVTDGLSSPTRYGAGVPDPADPARFTAPFVWNGVPGTWEYRLGDDDLVTIRLLDPAGFTARAAAARARAATQPGGGGPK